MSILFLQKTSEKAKAELSKLHTSVDLTKGRRRFMTLLEVMIALSLTIAVMTAVTFFYRHVSVVDGEIEKLKQEQFTIRFLENRLGDIIPKVVSKEDRKKDSVFFSIPDEGFVKRGTHSLIFTFDNGVSLNPVFSNHVLARLFVDDGGNLTLAYWPSPKRVDKNSVIPMKKEILLTGVSTLNFSFFVPPQQNGNEGEESDRMGIEEGWYEKSWAQEFPLLPPLVKIRIGFPEAGTKEKVFIFPLSNTKAHVIYKGEFG